MLDQLYNMSKGFDADKEDIGPDSLGRFRFSYGGDGGSFGMRWLRDSDLHAMTRHAFNQVCSRLGPARWGPGGKKAIPADYLWGSPAWMVADQLDHWRRNLNKMRKRDAKWLVRTYKDDVRAVLTDRYAVVDVTKTLEWMRSAINKSSRAMEVRPRYHVGPDLLHLRIIDRRMDTGKGVYGTGAYVTTGEIGNRLLGVYPCIWRSSCDNSISRDDENAFVHSHTGNAGILESSFIHGIVTALAGGLELLEQLLAEQNKSDFAHYEEHVSKVVKDNGWTEIARDHILLGSEGYENLFGLVNGITAAARKETDATVAADMELFAGGLLG